ncbi:MAG: transglycosylase SLT domain-containing protein [Mariprofundaceae bacterium]
MTMHSVHKLFVPVLVLLFSLLISACAKPESGHRALNSLSKEAVEKQTALNTLPVEASEKQDDISLYNISGSDELLVGIPLSEIAAAQAEVKRHIIPHWPKIADRSRYVRGRMVAVLENMEAPAGLQAIPVIESGYNPYALSYAGAMGLWQLMPRTARGLGVKNINGTNGRRDVESSTRAAVTYLLKMKERFGNWPLTFAAYHLGPTSVARRLRKQPWNPSDGINKMPVPSITKAYVRHVIGFAALLHMQTLKFPEPYPTQELKLLPPADLKQLASLSGISRDTLFRFNPGLDYAQYLKYGVSIHVPEQHLPELQEKVDSTGPKYVDVVISSGDSLWSLSRRHHTSLQHLRSLNPGIGNLLSIGKTIKAPANQLARARPTSNPLLSQGRRIRYKVRSGDSLWMIAKRFGTTSRNIARSNQISQNKLIRPGDTLWILARIRPS